MRLIIGIACIWSSVAAAQTNAAWKDVTSDAVNLVPNVAHTGLAFVQ